MIKVSVMYANELGARFDHTYYRDKHMPLVQARLGDACKYYTIDKGHFSRQRRQYRRLCGDVSYLQCHIFSVISSVSRSKPSRLGSDLMLKNSTQPCEEHGCLRLHHGPHGAVACSCLDLQIPADIVEKNTQLG
ncbi:EthD family reductase [Cupriavidus sp. CuC1]|uniref:EthD family reductase n=1 Tax=Cupriavidus sp. CuC1 TaxID=3373131 RepID=UPI0037D27973